MRRGYRRPPFFEALSLLRLIAVKKSQFIDWTFSVPFAYCCRFFVFSAMWHTASRSANSLLDMNRILIKTISQMHKKL